MRRLKMKLKNTNQFLSILSSKGGYIQLSESMALKAVSLLLALILWITILGFKWEEVKKNVPFEPLIAPKMMITNKIPTHIQFSLSGPRLKLREAERKIQPIRPDLRRTRESTIPIAISEDLIGELPSEVRVTTIYPPNLLIRIEEVIEKSFPVKVSITGEVAKGYEISSIRITPRDITILGPRSGIAELTSISTEPLDVSGLKGIRDSFVPVEVDTTLGFQAAGEKTVKVRVTAIRKGKEE